VRKLIKSSKEDFQKQHANVGEIGEIRYLTTLVNIKCYRLERNTVREQQTRIIDFISITTFQKMWNLQGLIKFGHVILQTSELSKDFVI
jgi:hypothetical protein